ncbi:MAG: DegV family protein [Sporichthyaceae bacterium]|nr:DegV family protein [Sporichthyaceae bacterium]
MPAPIGQVAVVTDSTAYLPSGLVAAYHLGLVPLHVVIDGKAYDETSQADAAMVADALRRHRAVTTSRPGPQAFLEAYRAAADQGYQAVVSVHLSAQMSGTYESACAAALEAPVPVQVLDSRLLGLGLGFAVLSAATAARDGATIEQVAWAALDRAAATSVYFYVDTLEYLRRGGRIGAARAWLGSALAVKPLLRVEDGQIALWEKVRTSTRAVARLEDEAVAAAVEAADGVDIGVHHLAAAERAAALGERLRSRVQGLKDLYVQEVGAVIGAHVGPGMLAVVVAPRVPLRVPPRS